MRALFMFFKQFKTSRCIGNRNKTMAKISPMTHIDSISGKYAKTDQVYTKVRAFDEQTFGVRLKHPATNEPPSAGQQTSQAKLASVAALVKTALADAAQKATLKAEWKAQKKYKTLVSYAFHKLYHSEQQGG